MKKVVFLALAFACAQSLSAQAVSDNKMYAKRPALGIHFTMTDFRTAQLIRSSSLASVLNGKQWTKPRLMQPGLAVSYTKGMSNHIDVQGRLGATFLDLPIDGRLPFGGDFLFLEGDASVLFKMLSDKYWISPYLSAGIGASNYKKGFAGAYMPLGVGLQVNFYDDAFLLINSQYRIPVAGNNNYHFFHSLGIAGTIGKKKEMAPPPPPVVVEVPKDSDGDGIFDKDDACPTNAGTAKYNGCPVPDTDKDGINDEEDKCINQPGTAKYNGCPIPDSDGDGINDEEDKCVNQAGVARYQGCPIPDGDGDGINDEEDKCPTEPGVASNQGCPEIKPDVIQKVNYAAKNIFFATGSAKLLAKSNKSLNEVAKIMTENPTLKLDVEGHTDNTGKTDKNLSLSESRAAAVKAYLVSKGIDESRLASAGYGQDQPVADNKTAAGRAKNRRVELKLKSF
jgi:OmpA-OmpF porin, OOP family